MKIDLDFNRRPENAVPTKQCSRCHLCKCVSEFGMRRRSLDGLQAWCRDCLRDYQREYARNHRDPKRHRINQQRYRSRHAHKVKAHYLVRKAVERGHLIVPFRCERCGSATELEAHHHDYAEPLEVEWLCSTCHGDAHRSAEGASR